MSVFHQLIALSPFLSHFSLPLSLSLPLSPCLSPSLSHFFLPAPLSLSLVLSLPAPLSPSLSLQCFYKVTSVCICCFFILFLIIFPAPSCSVPFSSRCHVVPHTSPLLLFSGEALRNRQHLGYCLHSWQNSFANSVGVRGF